MSVRKNAIEQKLQKRFSPKIFQLTDESYMHSVPEGAESHFKVVMVSDSFEGLSRVKRHQAVYEELGQELDAGLHALALHLFTPGEWPAKQGDFASPNCLGGSKADQ